MSITLHATMPARPGNGRPTPLPVVEDGDVDGDATNGTLIESLRSAAEDLGYFSSKRPSLRRVLRDFCKSVGARASFAPPYPDEARFARQALDYLRNADRDAESAKSLTTMVEIVSRLGRQVPDFDMPDTEICRLRFGAGHALELRGCPELIEPLGSIVKGWDLRLLDRSAEAVPTAMRVWKADGRYRWDMPFPGPYYGDDEDDDEVELLTSPIDILHEIHFFLDDVHTLECPSHFFVHSAAVEIAGAVVLLLGTHRTGKSTLAMALAARGYKVLADDRLAIDSRTGRAVAMGSAPLLRKPFPNDEGFWPAKSLIKRHRGPQDDEYAYVDLPEALFAARGYSKEVSAVIRLELSDRPIATALEPIARSEALKELVSRHYRKALKASAAFDGMLKLTEGAMTHSLRYSRTRTAVRAVEKLMSGAGAGREQRLLASA